MAALALLCGGFLSWFASEYPDGLEWSMEKTAGTTELESPDGLHQSLADLQEKTSFMPDYAFKADTDSARVGTSVAGVVGSAATLLVAGAFGLLLPRRRIRIG
jgi:cobalt/nickel transport system permease protein